MRIMIQRREERFIWNVRRLHPVEELGRRPVVNDVLDECSHGYDVHGTFRGVDVIRCRRLSIKTIHVTPEHFTHVQ